MNYDKYIGLPYLENGRTETGVDCWGLARLYYKDQLGIDLPSYSDEYSGGEDPAIVDAVNMHKDNWEETTTPNIGDLCLFNILGEPTHVGIFIGENKFLHSRQGLGSVIESLNNVKWKNRFKAFYTYVKQSEIEAIGAPHPLKTSVYRDWTVEGTTVQDLANFVKDKYNVSTTLANKIIIMINGIVVPQSAWETTVLQRGQQVSYKTVAEGASTRRLVLMLAVVVAAVTFGPEVGAFFEGTEVATVSKAYSAIGTMAVNMAGMALVNAIAPVRQASTSDAGSATALNLFTGASNQANKFGAIPVVLGKVRFTGMLGATPYVESLTDTSILNTAIVWGFGPLDVSDISIGGNPIEKYYDGLPSTVPRPVTLFGLPDESTAQFDKLYGRDVEQQFKNIELVNNITDGNAWTEVTLAQDADAIDIAFTFPEGMRKINTKDGKAAATTCQVEIQTRPYSTLPWDTTNSNTTLGIYKNGNADAGTLDAEAYTSILIPPSDPDSGYGINLYRYSIFCLSPTGGVSRFDGAVTDNLAANASADLQAVYNSTSYTNLLGVDKSWNYLPEIPAGYLKLYTVYQTSNGTVTVATDHVSTYSGVTGLTQTVTPIGTTWSSAGDGGDWTESTTKKISIKAGKIYSETATTVAPGQAETIWTSRMITNPAVRTAGSWKGWCNLLKNTSVWSVAANDTFNHTESNINFPYDGYYTVQAAADDEGEIYIDGTKVVDLPEGGFGNYVEGSIKLSKGNHSVTLIGRNSKGGLAAIGVAIGFTANSGLNIRPSANTIVTFGTAGFFQLRKDAFNYVHSLENLPRGRYQVRVKRLDSDETENETDYRKYHKVILSNVTSYDSQERPMVNPPGCYLARTAVRIQSTNKVNGNVDGINALVQTRTWDYDRTTDSWSNIRATNNPASLFIYVLTHPANAFRITSPNQLDLDSLTEWHKFCSPIPAIVNASALVVGKYYTIKVPGNTNWTAVGAGSNNIGESFYATGVGSGTGQVEYCPKYTYNSIITNTQSIMDTLRDICAAGLASPTYVDGKWGVVVDKPRNYTVQHFTPHNSWGFESNKSLPILPHAFRITIPDETQAYQPNELIIYNYGYAKTAGNGKKAAELFEQLTLPGVTDPDQAVRLARWHFAQIKLRPETYTLNVDFEHLVCSRGDLVKVTHDVPKWGTGSGRIKSVSGTTVVLTEEVKLEAGKSYSILIRINALNTTNSSVTKTLAPITTTGYTNTITLSSAISSADGVEVDNLFMLGEVNKETQQCVVIAIEPSNNYSARVTLADYGVSTDPNNPYNIFTSDLSGLLIYNANIATVNSELVKNSITSAPIINSINSTSALSEEVSKGNYQNVAIVSFANPPNLPAVVTRVQFSIIRSEATFDDTSSNGTYITNKETAGYTFTGLTSDVIYKVKARYLDATGKIAGPWSEIFTFLNDGKNSSAATPPQLTMDLDHTFIVAKPAAVTQGSDFLTYEYRLYKDTGSEDFWELDLTTNNIKVIRSTEEARFDLKDQPAPRISAAGITYRVACRTVDRTNNYSTTSTLGTIVVKTIT